MSLRVTLIGVCLFLGLTLANVIYHQRRLADLRSPYSGAGSPYALIAAAAAQSGAVADEQRGFVIREAGALLISGVLLLVFSGRPIRPKT